MADVKITVSGNAEETLQKYAKRMTAKAGELALKLAEVAGNDMANTFPSAIYAGTNDVVIEPPTQTENGASVSAVGNAVAFIEFGTGVAHPDSHPMASDFGAIHGTYGMGRGKNEYWTYEGDAGNAGEYINVGGRTKVKTTGNDANMCVYRAAQTAREQLLFMARDVLTSD